MIVFAVVLALLALVLLIPIRLFAEYHGAVRLWVRVLFVRIGILPKAGPADKSGTGVNKDAGQDKAEKKEAPAQPPPSSEKESAPPERPAASDRAEKSAPKRQAVRTEKPKAEKAETKRAEEPSGGESETLPERIARFLSLAEEFLGPLRRAIRRLIKVESLRARVSVGTDDAAQTAVYTGMLWGVGYGLIGMLDRIVKVENHDLNVLPSYSEPKLEAEADCILRTNLANIICAAAILGIAFLKYKLRRKKNERASVK